MNPQAPKPAANAWPKAVPLLILAGLLAYSNSFTKAFVFDDVPWILNNPDLPLGWRYVEVTGRPLVSMSILANYRLGGLNPLGYHAVNLTVHLLAGLTLFGLVRRVLLLPRFAGRHDASAPFLAFAVALLWLLHPLQTQAVTYIIQRAESMMGLFYLFALYAWVRGAAGCRWWYAAGVASFALSISCKEVAATLPFVLLVFDRIFLARSWRELVAARWPYYLGLAIVAGIAIRPLIGAALGGAEAAGVGFTIKTATPYQYLLTQSEAILHYLRLAFVPVGQTLDYLDWPIARSLGEVWPAFLLVSALLLGSIALLFIRPAAGFIGFWFFAILAPTSSIMPIIDPLYEHRMYLSLAAVSAGVVFGFAALLRRLHAAPQATTIAAAAALALTAVPLAGLTYARNEVYRSPRAFLEDSAAKRPQNLRPMLSLASIAIQEHNLEEARTWLERAEQVPSPFAVSILHWKASWLLEMGRAQEAERCYRILIAMPFHFDGSPREYLALAFLLLGQGRAEEAVSVLKSLIEHQPQVGDKHLALAAAQLAAGRESEAQAEAQEAVRLNSRCAHEASALARGLLFEPPSPATPLLKPRAMWLAAAACLAENDRDPQSLDTLALAYAWNGRFPEAAAAARRGIAAAEARGDQDWKLSLQKRLKLYEAGKPYTKDS